MDSTLATERRRLLGLLPPWPPPGAPPQTTVTSSEDTAQHVCMTPEQIKALIAWLTNQIESDET